MRYVIIGMIVLFAVAIPSIGGAVVQPERKNLSVPKLTQAPTLEDFEDMRPNDRMSAQMARADGFVQRDPSDGKPATQRTEVYLGYDDKALYAVFLAFDSQPQKIRARLSRRDDIWEDDTVEIWLDTFDDQRRAYQFACNPLGVQWDGTYSEGSGWDPSFDSLWYSRGKLTAQGYIVWMAIPFRTLRFRPAQQQDWGLILGRTIVREDESTFVPFVSARTAGYLTQEAKIRGLRNISPGRNMQFIPYVSFRSSRSMDLRDTTTHAYNFENHTLAPATGLDAKFILKDSLVLDATVNPDFSQVESDEPQATVNNRFELWYPERRPFFLENANYFETPLNLVFTRRIADPTYGLRLSGKTGPYSLGFLFADDASPGKTVPGADPLAGSIARFGVARVSRDIGGGSGVGLLYTDREYENDHNRVGGLDAHVRFDGNWAASAQAVGSDTRNQDGSSQTGPAYTVRVDRSGRQLRLSTRYNYISPDFVSEPGFITRTDIGRFDQSVTYRFRPEGRHLVEWGPSLSYSRSSDHDGVTLEERFASTLGLGFKGNTWLNAYATRAQETLRPVDFDTLIGNRTYDYESIGLNGQYGMSDKASVFASYGRNTRIDYVTPNGVAPSLANGEGANLSITLRPLSALKIDNDYSFSRTWQLDGGATLFSTQIVRSKWNWQFSRELSVRVIGGYNAVFANPLLTSLQPTRNLNFDFLLSYVLHPGTALHFGYNSDLQNLDPALRAYPDGSLMRTHGYINDGRQIFVKLSYLLRF